MAGTVGSNTDAVRWLVGELRAHLAPLFEARPDIDAREASEPPSGAGLYWRQEFSGIPGAIWICAADTAWTAAGSAAATIRSAYLEIVAQVFSGLGQSLTGKLGREIAPGGGSEASPAPGELRNCEWVELRLPCASGDVTIAAGFDRAFLDALVRAAACPEPELALTPLSHGNSKTFDLLMDVELPVRVSFGKAQVPLKDVLKLTTGSIVELDRSIAEPVEVIVNNCVIARGEVVVVEGYFGVRIQQVISRRERLNSLS